MSILAGAPRAARLWRMPDSTRFILLNTSHPGNVGAAARALREMGWGELVLVPPRCAVVRQLP